MLFEETCEVVQSNIVYVVILLLSIVYTNIHNYNIMAVLIRTQPSRRGVLQMN